MAADWCPTSLTEQIGVQEYGLGEIKGFPIAEALVMRLVTQT